MSNNKETDRIEIGLLDFGLRDASMNSLNIIEDVLDYARRADNLGFKRIWLTEHHISDSKAAWYNPFPILPLIAGMTKNIIAGVAGTQISMHNPYHVALNYKMLANLFPGRIDLGLATGKAPDNVLKYFTEEHADVQTKIRNVIKLLKEEDAMVNQEELIIPPFKGSIPEIWLLSSNYNRLNDVLEHGVSFSRSLFHGGDNLNSERERLDLFREEFFTKYQVYPKMTLAFSGCCHHTDYKAEQIAGRAEYFGITNINNTGSPEKFKDTILSYQENYGFNEFSFLNLARSPSDRKIGLKLIKKAFDI